MLTTLTNHDSFTKLVDNHLFKGHPIAVVYTFERMDKLHYLCQHNSFLFYSNHSFET